MANPMTDVLRHLQRAALRQDGAGLSDGELLEGFIAHREGACFEALVRRHGPMVLGVCRRVLRNLHDAEDAFQATFVVLAQRATSIVPRELVGNWLYGVAYRTALQARRATVRRKKRETQVPQMRESSVEEDKTWEELLPVLDRELNRLPAKYRVAVVLCHLEGRTRKEAARLLGLPVGTVSGRLTTALRRLAKRMSRYGLLLSGGTLAALLSPGTTSAQVSASLMGAAVQTGSMAGMGGAAAAGCVSANVLVLAKSVMQSMLLAKLKTLLTMLLVIALPATGAGWLACRTLAGPHRQVQQTEQLPSPVAKAERVPSDWEQLQGTWVALSGEENGQAASTRTLRSWGELTFVNNQVIRVGGEKREGTFTIDPSKQLREIDLFTEMNTWKGLYRLEGATLKLAVRFGENRPVDFDSREALLLVFAHQ